MIPMIEQFLQKAREIYGQDFIPLHRPIFDGNEQAYVAECIESNFVSSVGKMVAQFEVKFAEFTASTYGVATVNGTAALHTALRVVGVQPNTEVITQDLTFIATANAISYLDAVPIFLDVEFDTLGLSPDALESFLAGYAKVEDGECWNLQTAV